MRWQAWARRRFEMALAIVLVEPGSATFIKFVNHSAAAPRNDIAATFLLADDDDDGEEEEEDDDDDSDETA